MVSEDIKAYQETIDTRLSALERKLDHECDGIYKLGVMLIADDNLLQGDIRSAREEFERRLDAMSEIVAGHEAALIELGVDTQPIMLPKS